MRVMATCLVLALLGLGCGGSDSPKVASPAGPATNAETFKSTASEVVNGFTGKTAVDAGQRMKATLKKIGDKEQKDYEEALKQ